MREGGKKYSINTKKKERYEKKRKNWDSVLHKSENFSQEWIRWKINGTKREDNSWKEKGLVRVVSISTTKTSKKDGLTKGIHQLQNREKAND